MRQSTAEKIRNSVEVNSGFLLYLLWGIVNVKGTLSFANRECRLEFRFGTHQNS